MVNFWLKIVLPVLAGTVFISAMSVLKRAILKDRQFSPLEYLIVTFGSSAILFALIYLAVWGVTSPRLLPGFWTAVVLGAAANFLIQFFNAKAASIDAGEVSLTAPLQAMTPGLITGLALLLGEWPGQAGVLGVSLIACGSYVLLWSRTPERWYDYFGPIQRLRYLFRLGRLTPQERSKTLVVSLALGSAAMGTVGLLFDGLYTRRGIDLQGLILASMTLVGLLAASYVVWFLIRPDDAKRGRRGLALALAWTHNASPVPAIRSDGRRDKRIRGERWSEARDALVTNRFLFLLVLVVMSWVLHVLFIQPTYREAYVAYVGTLKRFSVLISVVSGYLLFGEQELKRRLWAAVLVVLGAFFISLDGLPERVSSRFEGLGF